MALYARVSIKDGRQGTENQLLQLRDYCTKQKWEIVQRRVSPMTVMRALERAA